MKTGILLTIAAGVIAVISCSRTQQEESKEPVAHPTQENVVELTGDQMKTAAIELGQVVQKRISGAIRVNGKLDVPPQQLVSISAPLGGFLKDTPLLQGSQVKKGQVIAIIENLDFIQIQQDYLEARTQSALMKAELTRQQELAKENVNSQKALQQAQANNDTWHARFNALREKLRVIFIDPADVDRGSISSTISLRSPIDGYVTEVNVNMGKFVSPTDVLFEIVDTRHLHAELIVFEKDIPKLKIGQKVRFTLANETRERTAVVYLIGREIGANRTIQIHCHIDREDRDLLPGMYLTAIVETGGAEVPALPNEAIVEFQGRRFVFVPKTDAGDHTFELVGVEAGNSELGFTEVTLPDSIDQKAIVVKGAYVLLSKMKNSEAGEEPGH